MNPVFVCDLSESTIAGGLKGCWHYWYFDALATVWCDRQNRGR